MPEFPPEPNNEQFDHLLDSYAAEIRLSVPDEWKGPHQIIEQISREAEK